ncbi:MAG: response regulator [Chlorobia bacterium]|nr:response regulator [Fimbriimonadaceae bacterium]
MSELTEPLVLHVEDNADDEMLVKRALRTGVPGNTLIAARDGKEACGYLFEGKLLGGLSEHRLPDLILLDLKLPIIGGLEILEKIRKVEATKRIPVVVLTSSDEARDIERCYQLGVNSYVAKPVDFEKFVEAVKRIGNYWLETNRTPWSADSFAAMRL